MKEHYTFLPEPRLTMPSTTAYARSGAIFMAEQPTGIPSADLQPRPATPGKLDALRQQAKGVIQQSGRRLGGIISSDLKTPTKEQPAQPESQEVFSPTPTPEAQQKAAEQAAKNAQEAEKLEAINNTPPAETAPTRVLETLSTETASEPRQQQQEIPHMDKQPQPQDEADRQTSSSPVSPEKQTPKPETTISPEDQAKAQRALAEVDGALQNIGQLGALNKEYINELGTKLISMKSMALQGKPNEIGVKQVENQVQIVSQAVSDKLKEVANTVDQLSPQAHASRSEIEALLKQAAATPDTSQKIEILTQALSSFKRVTSAVTQKSIYMEINRDLIQKSVNTNEEQARIIDSEAIKENNDRLLPDESIVRQYRLKSSNLANDLAGKNHLLKNGEKTQKAEIATHEEKLEQILYSMLPQELQQKDNDKDQQFKELGVTDQDNKSSQSIPQNFESVAPKKSEQMNPTPPTSENSGGTPPHPLPATEISRASSQEVFTGQSTAEIFESMKNDLAYQQMEGLFQKDYWNHRARLDERGIKIEDADKVQLQQKIREQYLQKYITEHPDEAQKYAQVDKDLARVLNERDEKTAEDTSSRQQDQIQNQQKTVAEPVTVEPPPSDLPEAMDNNGMSRSKLPGAPVANGSGNGGNGAAVATADEEDIKPAPIQGEQPLDFHGKRAADAKAWNQQQAQNIAEGREPVGVPKNEPDEKAKLREENKQYYDTLPEDIRKIINKTPESMRNFVLENRNIIDGLKGGDIKPEQLPLLKAEHRYQEILNQLREKSPDAAQRIEKNKTFKDLLLSSPNFMELWASDPNNFRSIERQVENMTDKQKEALKNLNQDSNEKTIKEVKKAFKGTHPLIMALLITLYGLAVAESFVASNGKK